MVLQIPRFPAGDRPPSYADMADLLVKAVPEADRTKARAILVEQILPKDLMGLPDHPKPRRLAEVVYEGLAKALQEADPGQRLKVLGAAASRAEIREQAATSLSLAVARYLKDHPEAAGRAGDWLNPAVQRSRAMSVGDLKAEASQRLERLEAWEKSAKADYPDVRNTYRLEFVHAKLNLQSARSGSFKTAAGSLYDFLTAVGASVDNLDIH